MKLNRYYNLWKAFPCNGVLSVTYTDPKQTNKNNKMSLFKSPFYLVVILLYRLVVQKVAGLWQLDLD